MRSNSDIERGQRLRAKRRELGLTWEAVAEEVGVHRNSIGYWERGSMPRDGAAGRLVKLYGLPDDFFYDYRSQSEREVREALLALTEQVAALTQVVQEMRRSR